MKNKIKIYFTYKHTLKPFGGANNFIRELYNHLKKSDDFEIIEDINSDFDVLFMNQLSVGVLHPDFPKVRNYKIKSIQNILNSKKVRPKLVIRAVNLRVQTFAYSNLQILNPKVWLNLFHYYKIDSKTIKILNLSDYVIFQSEYQKKYLLNKKIRTSNSVVIHNGSNNEFMNNNVKKNIPNEKIKIVTSINSGLKIKRHDLVAKLSLIDNTEIHYFGIWPKGLNSSKIIIHGQSDHESMKKYYLDAHFYYHSGYKEACSNSIIEALYSGLPVLYNPDIGSNAEIVGESGFPINENNMEKSLNFAVENYDSAIENLNQMKDYYSIDRAVKEYIEVFKKVVNS